MMVVAWQAALHHIVYFKHSEKWYYNIQKHILLPELSCSRREFSISLVVNIQQVGCNVPWFVIFQLVCIFL